MQTNEDIECCRLTPSIGEPHPRPMHFDERYVLPVHGEERLLQVTNKHTRDAHITFYEKPHIYIVNGNIVSQSISSLAHDFEEPFNHMFGINAMMKSKREAWPRKTYVKNPKSVDLDTIDIQAGCLLHDEITNITLSSLTPDASRNWSAAHILQMLQSVARDRKNIDKAILYNFEREETSDEIKEKWAKNGEDARNRGTEAHLQMELWFNSLPVRLDDPEVKVGIDFIRNHLRPIGAKAFKTEWEIYGEDEDIAGSIDLAVILPSGELFLIDWKRSEKLKSKMKGYKKMKEPLSNLEDCSGCSYALQLSSYQYTIEKYYGYKIVGRALVSLHPDAPFTTTVPYLKKEVEYIMNRRRLYNTTRKKLEQEFPQYTCCKTGRLVENTMVDADGKLYWEKAAIFHEIKETLTPCETTSKKIQKLLKEYTPLAQYINSRNRIQICPQYQTVTDFLHL
jgi:hypothetical protein